VSTATGHVDQTHGGQTAYALAPSRRERAVVRLFWGLLAGLAVASVVSLGVGAASLSPAQVVRVLLSELGLVSADGVGPGEVYVVVGLRLPRLLLGMLVGASLALAGAALQGVFRNPLADPSLIGVSGGASLGAYAVLVLGGGLYAVLPAWLQPWLLAVVAFVGGLGAVSVAALIAARRGGESVATLLLAGVALNAIAFAGVGVLSFVSDDASLRSATMWQLGSVAGATWRVLPVLIVIIAAGAALTLPLRTPLNALLLGDREAFHLGVPVRSIKRRAVLGSALLVGGAVAFSGLIGFVGLVVPHLLRLRFGPDHRHLLPCSALAGALLLVVADAAARTLAAPAELPVGVLTALLGGPYFVWLLVARGAGEGA
jgi:iron complex transport system permease protein